MTPTGATDAWPSTILPQTHTCTTSLKPLQLFHPTPLSGCYLPDFDTGEGASTGSLL
jgi:hypothetical protein